MGNTMPKEDLDYVREKTCKDPNFIKRAYQDFKKDIDEGTDVSKKTDHFKILKARPYQFSRHF